jgi:hypothetical protein
MMLGTIERFIEAGMLLTSSATAAAAQLSLRTAPPTKRVRLPRIFILLWNDPLEKEGDPRYANCLHERSNNGQYVRAYAHPTNAPMPDVTAKANILVVNGILWGGWLPHQGTYDKGS